MTKWFGGIWKQDIFETHKSGSPFVHGGTHILNFNLLNQFFNYYYIFEKREQHMVQSPCVFY